MRLAERHHDRLKFEPIVVSSISPADVVASWGASRPRTVRIGAASVALALALGWLACTNPRYGVALAAVAVIVLVVVLQPRLGALGLVALVPSLSGLQPGIPIPNIRISELMIGAVGITLLVVARRSGAVAWGALDWGLLFYGMLWTFDGALGAISGHQHLSVGGWGTVAGQLQFFLLYRALRVTLHSTADRHLALRVLFWAAGVVASLAIMQEAKVPGVIPLLTKFSGSQSAGGVGGVIRATSLFGNWAALAGYLFPLVFVAICLGLAEAIRSHKVLHLGLAAVLTLALFVTAELSVIVCLLIGVCVLGARYGRGRLVLRWIGVGFAIVAIGAGSLLVQRLELQLAPSAGSNRPVGVPQTLDFRWSVWTDQYLPAIEQRPLTGYGIVLPTSIRWIYPESQYVSFLIQGGFPLLGVFGLLSWAMLRSARQARKCDDPIDRALGEGLCVAVVALIAVNVIWPFLSNGGLPQVMWCLFALLPARSVRLASQSIFIEATPIEVQSQCIS